MVLVACSAGDSATDSATTTGVITPGDRIARLLRSDDASSLTIRVFLPAAEVVPGDPWPRMTELLESVTDKPGGVSVTVREVSLPDQPWSLAQLNTTLDGLYVPPGSDEAVIDVLAVHGDYVDDPNAVLGLGWAWSRIAVFIDPIDEACGIAAGGGAGTGHSRICEATWAAILRHETGHVLGLVDNELPMVVDHEDPAHPHHDPNPDCLMYYAWDRSELSGKVADEDLNLCQDSLDDLASVRDAAE